MSIDLARRLAEAKSWRWLRCCPWVEYLADGRLIDRGIVGTDRRIGFPERLPDTDSPALPGIVLHLVRLAWGDPSAHVMPCNDGTWRVWFGSDMVRFFEGQSELEALTAALEAAP